MGIYDDLLEPETPTPRGRYDDLLNDGPAPDDEPDLSEIGGQGLKGMGNAGAPMRIYGAGARRPEGMVETGRVARTTVLPEMTGLERPGDPIGPITEIEDREVRDALPAERALDAVGDFHPFGFAGPTVRETANQFGLEAPSSESARAASQQGLSPSERISAYIRTAPRPQGMSPSDPDLRTEAGVLGLQNASRWLLDRPMRAQAALTGGDFDRERADAEQRAALAAQQAPIASAAGAAVPDLALGLVGGAPTGGTALGRIGRAAATYGALGALRGSDGGDDLRESLEGAATGGAAGAASGAGGQAVAEGASWLGPRLAQLLSRGGEGAQDLAAVDRMRASGLPVNAAPNTAYGRQVQRMGGERGIADLLNRENVGGRMLPTPASSAQDAERIFGEAGQALDDVHGAMQGEQIDPRGLVDELRGTSSDLAQVRTGPDRAAARRIERQLIAPLLEELPAGTEGPAAVEPMTFEQAHAQRQAYDRIANYRNANPSQGSIMDAARGARGTLSDLMSNAASDLSPEVGQQWQRGNQLWQLGALLRDNARAQGSQLPGAIAEGVANGAGGQLAARATRAVTSSYGPALRARGLQGIAAALRSMGGAAARYAPVIEQAMQAGGPRAAAITHYLLNQRDPNYRAAYEQAQQQEQPQ